MKRLLIVLMTALVLLLNGCSGFSFEMTRVGDDTTIEAKADDGKYAETDYFTVGKNEEVIISSELNKGKLQIDFAEAFVFISTDSSPNEVTAGEVIKSVTVSGQDSVVVDLPEGDYLMQITAIGRTEGIVKINVAKK